MKLTKFAKVLIYIVTIGIAYGYSGLIKLSGQAVEGDKWGTVLLIVWSLALVWWCMFSLGKEDKYGKYNVTQKNNHN